MEYRNYWVELFEGAYCGFKYIGGTWCLLIRDPHPVGILRRIDERIAYRDANLAKRAQEARQAAAHGLVTA